MLKTTMIAAASLLALASAAPAAAQYMGNDSYQSQRDGRSGHNSGNAQSQTFMRFFGHPAYQGSSSAQDRAVAGRTAQERSTGVSARQ